MTDIITKIIQYLHDENLFMLFSDDETGEVSFFGGWFASSFYTVFSYCCDLFIGFIKSMSGLFKDLGYKMCDIFDGVDGYSLLCNDFVYFFVGGMVFFFCFKLAFKLVNTLYPL